jgi:hypothetical protein
MTAVEASRPDLPADTADPVYSYGFGLSYEQNPGRLADAP